MLSGIFGLREPFAEVTNQDFSGESLQLLRYNPGQLIPVRCDSLHWAIMRRELLTLVGDNAFDRIAFSGVYLPEDFSFLCE